MIKLKICGLRRDIDIEYVNKHLPDYIGFVFAQSKRRVEPHEARRLTEKLDKSIKTVGVFVNEEIEKVLEISEQCKLDVVQMHGDESPEYIKELYDQIKGTEVWKAIRVKNLDSIKALKDFKADAYLLDAYVEGTYGGAGKTFDWGLAAEAKKYGRIILAGGLNLINVGEAAGLVQPFAVDISSGVETDGFKDEEKIKDFIYSVRRSAY